MRTAVALLVASGLATIGAEAQVLKLTREQMIRYTAKNPYERFPDGRPKVPDSLIEKVKGLSAEEMMLAPKGFPNNFAGDLQILHPEKKLVGRAFTVQIMPARSDITEVDRAEWSKTGAKRPWDHQVALDMLQPGDVLVLEAAANTGGIVGDNLAFFIWKRTGNGFVIDGPIRDLDGIAEFDMPVYYRSAAPPWLTNGIVTGINIPVRIGNAIVMPGDVVVGDREGVSFIPPQVLQEVLDTADIVHVHDEWTKKKFAEGKYGSRDIYSSPSDPALIQEYEAYLKEKLGESAYQRYLKEKNAARPAQPAK
ncbi:MAG: dimethylmenaquinone methyltransferase [Bryobacteraceae bacterium]|jgi:regulator of RNase E activity RraA